MNFEFSDEQQALRDEARKFLARQCPLEEVHRILNSGEHLSQPVWDAIVDMGWTGTALPPEYGGFGMGYLELCVLSEELGRASAPVPFSSAVYLAAECLLLAGTEAQKAEWLPKLVDGKAIGTLATVNDTGNGQHATTVANGKLSGTKIVVPDAQVADYAIVSAQDGDDPSLYIVQLAGDGVSRTTQSTIDPTRSYSRIDFDDAAAEPLGDTGEAHAILDAVYDRAAILFAFEQLGGAQAALDMSCRFACERFAFGRPIGSFQGIKHRLAEMYVMLELARSNCYHGAYALSSGAEDLPIAAAAARVAASRSFYECARENTHVHGGMGFSWDGDCHLYYRRAKVLALALGGERRWNDKLVHRLNHFRDANGSPVAGVAGV